MVERGKLVTKQQKKMKDGVMYRAMFVCVGVCECVYTGIGTTGWPREQEKKRCERKTRKKEGNEE